MSTGVKLLLVLAAILIVLALVAGICWGAVSCVQKNGFAEPQLTGHTHEAEGEFSQIRIETVFSDIEFIKAEGNCRVVTSDTEKLYHKVEVENGVLTVRQIDTRKWIDQIGIIVHRPKTTVYLPAGEYDSLTVKADTGSLTIPAWYSFGSIDIKGDTASVNCMANSGELRVQVDTGSVTIDGITAGRIDISTDTGRIGMKSVTNTGKTTLRSDTGKVSLTDISCSDLDVSCDTGGVTLTNVLSSGYLIVKCDTGSVTLDRSDAASIRIDTDTGSIRGTLLTGKQFFASSSLGSVSVPESTEGAGRCELTTDTGSIKIEIG